MYYFVSCSNYRLKKIYFFQIDTFASIYKKLTGREVTFEFPEPYL